MNVPKQTFIQVYEAIIDQEDLNSNEILALCKFIALSSAPKGCIISNEEIAKFLKTSVRNVGKILKSLMSNGFALINLISLLLIMPVVTFYMLRDWDDFVKKFESLLPKKSKKGIMEGFKEIDKIIAGFIRGQLSVCLILGLFYSVGLKLVGLELGLLVGFIAGIISFIPYVGSITGFILGCVLAFAQYGDISHVLYVIAVFMLGQFIEGNFLTPKLVGESVGLHPVWVMFALLAGGVLLGFLGLMLAVPLAAIIGVLVRYGIKKYKQSSLYLD